MSRQFRCTFARLARRILSAPEEPTKSPVPCSDRVSPSSTVLKRMLYNITGLFHHINYSFSFDVIIRVPFLIKYTDKLM
ncbi:unnamed protein product [Leptidea sinapis]|uniref:Uncharacterized protein n=1 Tax=Leptidea sinapis TaxID=189913 RepID=A0A5E4PWH5_9NEOP|nr:unnamed protein product [Leptidea sinapis]